MKLCGEFEPPGDKSISHRLALMSLLAEGSVAASHFSMCADVRSSLGAVQTLGAPVDIREDRVTIGGAKREIVREALIDCGNSGTTMRLLMGILAGLEGRYVLDGDDSLRQRPMERVAAPLRRMGADIQCASGRSPVTVQGGELRGIEFELPTPSAQLKSAALLAGAQAAGATTVVEPIVSRDHTERLLTMMGASLAKIRTGWRVERAPLKLPSLFNVPGDSSSAAFFLCAAAVIPGSEIIARNTLLNPTRFGFARILLRMGANIQIEPGQDSPEPVGTVSARYSPRLTGCRIDAGEIPGLIDEVPILSLVATQAQGATVFEGAGELRVKETDRLSAIAEQLGAMGARIAIDDDKLIIEGPTPLKARGSFDSLGDHRIAMTLRLAGLLDQAEPAIRGEECVAISYPEFHDTLRALSQ